MQNEGYFNDQIFPISLHIPRQLVVGVIFVVALFAFELFNFDTTQYALANLLGEVSFLNFRWATILAIAFCAIDFAGLARLFTPPPDAANPQESKETWYLMGAWLLGATMNALMTWWAVSLTLLNHDLGNEVLSREQLLRGAPIFLAVLVWLTRILFIGSISLAGDHLFRESAEAARLPSGAGRAKQPALAPAQLSRNPRRSNDVPGFIQERRPMPTAVHTAADAQPEPPAQPVPVTHSRLQRRPPQPGAIAARPAAMQAGARRQRG